MHIINTYVPHMGYGRNERDEYRRQIKQIATETPQNDIIIWTTDNNGQIARPVSRQGGGNMLTQNAHIGHWHYSQESENGNGGN